MRFNRGDTIIEVMISTAIAALIIVMAITVMNRNLATVQMATEITFARQAVDSQAEALRYLRDEYNTSTDKNNTEWHKIAALADTNNGVSDFGTCMEEDDTGKASLPGTFRPFYINGIAKNNQDIDISTPQYVYYTDPTLYFTYPQSFPSAGSGVWVEVKKGADPAAGSYQSKYLDLHIRACWDPPYESNNVKATIGTIVRLYYE